MRWRVLERLGIPPSDARARAMSEGDYLYCYIQTLLDDDEGISMRETAVNRSFDPSVYLETGGGAHDHSTAAE